MHRGYSVGITRRGCATGPLSKGRRAAQLPERPSSACSSSTLRGDLRTSAPGAYLPAVSASGTCAYRRAARAARRPDLMDKPSLQTSQAIAGTRRTATPALLSRARYARCSSFPQGRDGCTAVQNPRVGRRRSRCRGAYLSRGNRWRNIQLDGESAWPLAARASSRRKHDAGISAEWWLSYLSAADFGANNSV
jgi:hypothetical protein